jgi:hypothetical protein
MRNCRHSFIWLEKGFGWGEEAILGLKLPEKKSQVVGYHHFNTG